MANTFLIKHGSSAPTSSNLQSYELGFSTSTNSLYLNNGSAILRFPNSDQSENTFLQLSGGTLTGVLNGTSIVCTGNITAPNFIGIASSANATNARSNFCDIAQGYNYDSGELHINYECATTGKPILKYIFRDGNKGYSSIYCKNLETTGTITVSGSATINGSAVNDFVVGHGCPHYIAWEKTKSGVLHCWLNNTVTLTGSTPTASMGGYNSYVELDMPVSCTVGGWTGVASGRLGTGYGSALVVGRNATTVRVSVLGNQNSNSIELTGFDVYGKG